MKFKHIVTAVLVAGLSLAAVPGRAEGPRFFPVTDPGFTFEPTLALAVGAASVTGSDEDAILMYGLDFNFNCLLMQTPANRMRTHLQLDRTEKSGAKSTALELSPRYTLPLGSGFAVGLGPVLALVLADYQGSDEALFGYGAVVGPEYRAGMVYAGLDLRYLATTENAGVDFENWSLLAKVGLNF